MLGSDIKLDHGQLGWILGISTLTKLVLLTSGPSSVFYRAHDWYALLELMTGMHTKRRVGDFTYQYISAKKKQPVARCSPLVPMLLT